MKAIQCIQVEISNSPKIKYISSLYLHWQIGHGPSVLWCTIYQRNSYNNLTSNDSIMEILQSLFTHRFGHFVHGLLCVENTFNTQTNVLTNEVWNYGWIRWMNELHHLMFACAKCVFNPWYPCAEYKLCTISMTKLLIVRLVMITLNYFQ